MLSYAMRACTFGNYSWRARAKVHAASPARHTSFIIQQLTNIYNTYISNDWPLVLQR